MDILPPEPSPIPPVPPSPIPKPDLEPVTETVSIPKPETDPEMEEEVQEQEEAQKVVVVPNLKAAADRRKRAWRNLIFIILGAAIAGGVFWAFREFSTMPLEKLAAFETQVTSEVQQATATFPAPLKASQRTSQKNATLTISGIITDTNAARSASSVAPLAENATLDGIATIRLEDMFAHQYFAHVSPTGESALTVASSVGYDHLALGENLAEGWFAGDQGLVTAWMNSPGHRANILDAHYTQIGVAAREGIFNGQQAWIAVQVFGKPASACPPAPDPSLEAAITNAEGALAAMSSELLQMKQQIETMQPQSGATYNDKVSQYNTLVSQYNTLASQTKAEVAAYNAAVKAYNSCL